MVSQHFPAGIYPILDLDACEARSLKPQEVVAGWKEYGWAPYQLRAKNLSAPEYAALAESLHQVWMNCHVDDHSTNRWLSRPAIIANDFLEVAWHHSEWFCGIHLGQTDLVNLSPREEQMLLQILESGGIAGCSTHSAEQFTEALASDAIHWSYVALGPVYPTNSKTNSRDQNSALGLQELAEIMADSGFHSLFSQRRGNRTAVLIGGMTPSGWQDVLSAVASLDIKPEMALVPAVIASILDSAEGWAATLDRNRTGESRV